MSRITILVVGIMLFVGCNDKSGAPASAGSADANAEEVRRLLKEDSMPKSGPVSPVKFCVVDLKDVDTPEVTKACGEAFDAAVTFLQAPGRRAIERSTLCAYLPDLAKRLGEKRDRTAEEWCKPIDQ